MQRALTRMRHVAADGHNGEEIGIIPLHFYARYRIGIIAGPKLMEIEQRAVVGMNTRRGQRVTRPRALVFDRAGRLLILKPTYKSGWTIPGGVMEADGETPWEACRREVREECGIEVRRGRLACMESSVANIGLVATSFP